MDSNAYVRLILFFLATCNYLIPTYLVYRDIKNLDDAWPFLEPVSRSVGVCFWRVAIFITKQEYPEYYEVISEPIDLKLIGIRMRDKYYQSRDAFTRDLFKMLENCRKFNTPSSEVYKCADRVQQYIKYVLRVHLVLLLIHSGRGLLDSDAIFTVLMLSKRRCLTCNCECRC